MKPFQPSRAALGAALMFFGAAAQPGSLSAFAYDSLWTAQSPVLASVQPFREVELRLPPFRGLANLVWLYDGASAPDPAPRTRHPRTQWRPGSPWALLPRAAGARDAAGGRRWAWAGQGGPGAGSPLHRPRLVAPALAPEGGMRLEGTHQGRWASPVWTTAAGFSPVFRWTLEAPTPGRGQIWFGLQRAELRLDGGPQTLWLYPQPVLGPWSARFDLPPGTRWTALDALGLPDSEPRPADPGSLLVLGPETWRRPGWEWYAWDQWPSVWFVVTADYGVQDRMFKRLAFFVEKAGFRGQLLTESELEGRHGYNAHNYETPDLARFFSLAESQGLRLTEEELWLLNALESQGWLQRRGPGGWQAPARRAVLSISWQSPPALRRLLMTHEAFHGVYFIQPEWQAETEALYDALPQPARQLWAGFLRQADYDPDFRFMTVNELVGYWLQYDPSQWGFFLRERLWARGRRLSPAEVFQAGSPALDARLWLDLAQALARGARRYGLEPGEVRRLRWF